jgi:hypothetical protein
MALSSYADRAARLRRYADVISGGATPVTAPREDFSNPNWARLFSNLIRSGVAGSAGREATRLDEMKNLQAADLARTIAGVPTVGVQMPERTGPLAGLDRFLGFGNDVADDGSIAPASPTGSDYQSGVAAAIGQAERSGVSPLLAATAYGQARESRTKFAATELATERARNLREATGLYWTIKEAGDAADPEMVARFNELSVNLPGALPAVEYEQRDVAGKTALIPVNILGQIAGKPTFAPSPLIDYGGREEGKLEARQKFEGTPAEKKMDEAFGKALGELRAAGGLADVEKNKQQLESVVNQLRAIVNDESDENLSGAVIGAASSIRAVMSMTHPVALQALEQVEEVVQRNLRIILGAQFTQKEGERLISRAYNPYLDEADNLVRLERLAKSMAAQLDNKLAAIAYFDENGTLRGFKGEAPDAQSITNTLVEDLTTNNPIPIAKWDKAYFRSFIGRDGKLNDEWKKLLEDPNKKTKIENRMKELGLIKG